MNLQSDNSNFNQLKSCSDVDFTGMSADDALMLEQLNPVKFNFGAVDIASLGLDKVENYLQLKEDFTGYPEKLIPNPNDISIINDSQDSNAVKSVYINELVKYNQFIETYIDISSAEFINAYNTPKQVLPLAGAGNYYNLECAYLYMKYKSIPYTFSAIGGSQPIQELMRTSQSQGGGGQIAQTQGNKIIGATSDLVIRFNYSYDTALMNLGYWFTNRGQAWANGNSDFKLFLRYRIISI